MTQLSEQQIRFFETFGFLKFPGLLSDRIEPIIADFENVFAQRGGPKHEGKLRTCIPQLVDRSETLSTLLDDPRILGIATSLVGDDFNYMGSDGNYYVGDTGWHSDGWHEHIRHIKIAFYLDAVTSDTGALRVIPGSHLIGDTFAQKCQDILGSVEGRDVPAYSLDSQPGDVVCFNHNLKHAAFGGSTNRRMFTMNLCQRYPEARLQELRDYISGGARFWVERAYGEAVVQTADASRMAHLEQVMANDGHLAELSRKAREEMAEPARG